MINIYFTFPTIPLVDQYRLLSELLSRSTYLLASNHYHMPILAYNTTIKSLLIIMLPL